MYAYTTIQILFDINNNELHIYTHVLFVNRAFILFYQLI